MLCRKCKQPMSVSGTTYEPKKNKGDKGYRRYNECPNCHYRKYHDGINFQEEMNKAIQKKQR